jgi:hypothetical protein
MKPAGRRAGTVLRQSMPQNKVEHGKCESTTRPIRAAPKSPNAIQTIYLGWGGKGRVPIA